MVPPAFVITPSPLGEGRGEVNHGNNLGCALTGAPVPLTIWIAQTLVCALQSIPCEGNLAKGISSLI